MKYSKELERGVWIGYLLCQNVLKPQLRADYYYFLSQIQNCNGNVLGNVFCKEHIQFDPQGLDFDFSVFYESDYLAFTLQQQKVNFSKNGFLYQYIPSIIGCNSPPSTNKAQLALYASPTYLFLQLCGSSNVNTAEFCSNGPECTTLLISHTHILKNKSLC